MLMDLYIETLTGVSFELRVSPAETVMSIKSKIQRAEGIPVTQQHLIWQDGELDDHRRLRDYSISEGSTLRLVLGLCGGPLNTHRVPPLRLAPLHIPSSTSSVISRVRRCNKTNRTSNIPPSMALSKSVITATRTNKTTQPTLTADRNCSSPDVSEADQPNDSAAKQISLTSGRTTGRWSNGSDDPPPVSTANSDVLAGPAVDSKTSQPATGSEPASRVADEPKVQNTVSPSEPSADTTPSVGYPPLFPGCQPRAFSNLHDLSSLWRLYEPHSWSSLSKALLFRNSYPVISASDHESDSTPPGSAGDSESHRLSQHDLVDKNSGVENDGNTSDYTFPNTTAATSSSTTLLAGLLSTTGDKLDIPCQTSGGEHYFDYDRQYYQALETQYFLDDFDFLRRHRLAALFWTADDSTTEVDPSLGPSIDLDTLREEDDDDEEDEDGEDSVATKDRYTFELDGDDDSLTDLEDYMFYYRTGDLLFAPPRLAAAAATTVYPHYSYETVGDSYPSDLEVDLGLYTNQPSGKGSSKKQQQQNTQWQEERAKMAAKVNELKNKMKELRIRRQESKARKAASEARHPTPAVDTRPEVSATISNHSDEEQPNDSKFQDDSTLPNASPSESKDSNVKTRQRCRRFGTVIPPEPASLIQPDPSTTSATDASTTTLHSSAPSLLTPIVSSHPWTSRPLSGSVKSSYPMPDGWTCFRPPGCDTDCRPLADWPSTFFRHSMLTGTSRDRPRTSVIPRQKKSKVPGSAHLHFANNTALTPLSLTTDRAPECEQESSKLPAIPCSKMKPSSTTTTIGSSTVPRSPPKQPRSPPNSSRRKRCALCLRKIGIVNSYSCRCGRNFCSRHRYAETHSCQYDYKAEGRRTLIEANPVITAPKLPKI